MNIELCFIRTSPTSPAIVVIKGNYTSQDQNEVEVLVSRRFGPNGEWKDSEKIKIICRSFSASPTDALSLRRLFIDIASARVPIEFPLELSLDWIRPRIKPGSEVFASA